MQTMTTSPPVSGPPDEETDARTPLDAASAADRAEETLGRIVEGFGGQPRESQIAMARHVAEALADGDHSIVQAPTGTGKALDVDTPVPTPAGFTRMGDLQVGDVVFDEHGRPCNVTAAFAVMEDRPCYELEFSDGSMIVADAEHEWVTHDATYRDRRKRMKTSKRAAQACERTAAVDAALAQPDLLAVASVRELAEMTSLTVDHLYQVLEHATPVEMVPRTVPCGQTRTRSTTVQLYDTTAALRMIRHAVSDPTHGMGGSEPTIRTTNEIRQTLKRWGRSNHAVPVAGSLDLPETDLPVDSYVLGVWLGDGFSNTGMVGSADPFILEEIERIGHEVVISVREHDGFLRGRIDPGTARWEGFRGFTGVLDDLGVLNNKHIPASYLRADFTQRLALLQGLMDTDGHASRSGSEFVSVDLSLAEQVRHLAATLGLRPTIRSKKCRYKLPNGEHVEPGTTAYTVAFTTDMPVFRLPRKIADHAEATAAHDGTRTEYRYITDVRPVDSRPVRCIQVDSPSHLFLAGEQMIPTHNSLAYLVPAAHLSKDVRQPVVVATATKTLQAQLMESDLEMIRDEFPDLRFALLKGRGNFVCRAQVKRTLDDGDTLFTERVDGDVWDRLRLWLENTGTGDRDDVPDGVTDSMWSKVSVGSDGCVGTKCAFYTSCFSEMARDRAKSADVVVTNHHMLLIDKLGGGWVLPSHAAVVVDEGHKLVETASSIAGESMRPTRFKWMGDFAKSLGLDDKIVDGLYELEKTLELEFEALVDTGRVDTTVGSIAVALNKVSKRASKARSAALQLKFDDTEQGKEAATRRDQFSQACESAVTAATRLAEPKEDDVIWVDGGNRRTPTMRSAPLNLSELLREALFAAEPVVMTSATLTVGGAFDHLIDELGASRPDRDVRTLSVPSPFDYENNALLYVPTHLPPPKGGYRSDQYKEWDQGAKDTTLELVRATEGRALLLFTSWKRLNDTAEFLELKVPFNVMRQGDAPPARLIERLEEDEHSVLCATASFWEGVSVEGSSVSLVVVDKLPFGRRDDPLLSAMRDRADENGGNGFHDVDLPRTSRMLAQGTGRLIRCFDTDTELLTDEGWMSFEQLRPGMVAYGITEASLAGGDGLRGDVPKLATNVIREVQANETPEPMLRIKSQHTDIRVTPDHGMMVQTRSQTRHKWTYERDGRTYADHRDYQQKCPPIHKMRADEMPNRGRLPLAGRIVRRPTKLQKGWFTLLGLIITDGSLSDAKPTVELHQSTAKQHVVDKIDTLLEALSISHNRFVTRLAGTEMSDPRTGRTYPRNGDLVRWQITGHDAARIRDVIHRGWKRRYSEKRAYNNRSKWAYGPDGWYRKDAWKDIEERESIPRWVFERASAPQMEALLEGLMAGDGTWNSGDAQDYTSGVFYTAVEGLADDVQELLVITGYRSTKSFRRGVWEVRFNRQAMMTYTMDENVISDDGLSASWCVTTDLGNVVVRRNGQPFIAGNTTSDFGVVAVLDPRIAQTAAAARRTGRRGGYGDKLLADLPPMQRTINLHADDTVGVPDDLASLSDDDLHGLVGDLLAVRGGAPAADWLRVRLALESRRV